MPHYHVLVIWYEFLSKGQYLSFSRASKEATLKHYGILLAHKQKQNDTNEVVTEVVNSLIKKKQKKTESKNRMGCLS